MDWLNILFVLLIGLLGHTSYQVRERANRQLARFADVAIEQLKAGEQHQDPEIRARCRPLVDAWHRRHADKLVDTLLPPGWDNWPWIDCLGEESQLPEYCALRWAYLEKARQGHCQGKSPWPDYAAATRLWIRDRIAARLPVTELLERLCEGHREYCRRNGYAVPP